MQKKERPRNTTALPKCSHLGESLSCRIKFWAVLESSHSSEEGFGCIFQYKLLKEKKKPTYVSLKKSGGGWWECIKLTSWPKERT